MRASGPSLICSATDLANFLGCQHRTAMEMAVARGAGTRPYWNDPFLELLRARGLEHERAYLASLRSAGLNVVDLSGLTDPGVLIAATRENLAAGVDVVAQGALGDNAWFGRPDVLRRVSKESSLGTWSYEAIDTKLSQETRPGTILQLSLYSDLLAAEQGVEPEQFYVVTPDPVTPVQAFRVQDFDAYVRLVRRRLSGTVARAADAVASEHYPEPVDHCDVCPWSGQCSEMRRRDDHLSLVAGATRLQRAELEARGVTTTTALAALPLPLEFKPRRGSAEALARAREQARLQVASRDQAEPAVERRPVEEARGLAALPEPSPGDVFLDLEGDAFAVQGGREYLFGIVTQSALYRSFWGLDAAGERAAFEAVMDLIAAQWELDPGMHVYHYGHYEPSALKRLAGRYASRAELLDRLLRGKRFVDLLSVVRQGLVVGVERYSIKCLEPLYAFARSVALTDASLALRAVELALAAGTAAALTDNARTAVEGYNRDDCLSTLALRDWLETTRARALAEGTEIPRPLSPEDAAAEEVDERQQRVNALRERLLTGVPPDPISRTPDQQARWILAYLLDFHRREAKADFWEFYRLCELPPADLIDERKAVASLRFAGQVEEVLNKRTGKPTGSVVQRYTFPEQDVEIRAGDELRLQTGETWGEVVATDRMARTVDVKKGKKQAGVHASEAFAFSHVRTDAMEAALLALGEAAAASQDASTLPRSAQDVLLRRPPRLVSGTFGSDAAAATAYARDIVLRLSDTCLAIQGPPGAGKTYTGAQMVVALARAGRRVGVMAHSHKAIETLMQAVVKAAGATAPLRLARIDSDDDADTAPGIQVVTRDAGQAALASGEIDVLGGTVFVWSRPEFGNTVDTLFVDEAGQMSLANVLAAATAARNLVLLGDPQQLEQPLKGTHPDGVGVSALEHILNGLETIPADRGLFLPETWRLAPPLAEFTSRSFYDGRLRAKPGLELQALTGTDGFDGAGLWTVPVDHDGNQNSSPEEVEAVARLVDRLLAAGAAWTDEGGNPRPLSGEGILVVSPYNAQVNRLTDRLAERGLRVGTVDKFQGQEAPVVIYSMATSRPEDAPRGMEFLYSRNRLNVATSRARCAVFLVTSPRLLEPECRSPRQMKLANALCAYAEVARPASAAS
ncbi:MAG: TM0106 family RecB-like putative nuclease [Vicinamibacterales bacterium]